MDSFCRICSKEEYIKSIEKKNDCNISSKIRILIPTHWFSYREQAGAQKGRGCIEQIVTLRILCDYANKKKSKLFYNFC